jgi:hypothetical protein
MLVYKYRGGNDEIFERDLISLEKNYFWSAGIEELNDPCEAITNNSLFKKQYSFLGKVFGIKSKGDLELLDKSFDDFFDHDKKMGIYSLSQSFIDELLWAHYGNSHKGFCIGYDLDTLLLSDGPNNIHSYPINYEKNPPKIGIMDIRNSSNGVLIKKLGFYKSKRWEYEKEFRIITNNIGKHFYNYDALKSIYFGLQMPDSQKDQVMNRLKGRGINYYQIEQLNNTYKFGVRRIKNTYPTNSTYLTQVPISVTKNEVLNYKLLKSKIVNYPGIGEFDIELEVKTDDRVLKWLALHLKENLFINAKTLFINYYLKPFSSESIPWASSNYKDGEFVV